MIAVASAMPDSPTSSNPSAAADTRRPFVVVTGLSGAGRVTALHALDDMGYVAVDNVPLPLLGDLMRSTTGSPGEMAAPLAFGIDTRTYGFDPHDLVRRVQGLRGRSDIAARLLFLECDTRDAAAPLHRIAPAASAGARPAGARTASSRSASRSAGCAIRPTS